MKVTSDPCDNCEIEIDDLYYRDHVQSPYYLVAPAGVDKSWYICEECIVFVLGEKPTVDPLANESCVECRNRINICAFLYDNRHSICSWCKTCWEKHGLKQ